MNIEPETIRHIGTASIAIREVILSMYKRDHGASYRAMQSQVDAGSMFYRVSTIQRGSAYEIALDCVDALGIGPRIGSFSTKSVIPN